MIENKIKVKPMNWLIRDLKAISYTAFGTFEITRPNIKDAGLSRLVGESNQHFNAYISRPTTDECIECETNFATFESAQEWCKQIYEQNCWNLFETK